MSDITTAFTAKGAELLARTRELVPTLRQRAAEAEKLRRVPPESIDDLRKAGLFRTLQPVVLGGYELPLDEAVVITATVAQGCSASKGIVRPAAHPEPFLANIPVSLANHAGRCAPVIAL
jgi:3-hydroxy-9,10-secoandrosta-1,3,5(10)-triene-9,17-dione monooxygenase